MANSVRNSREETGRGDDWKYEEVIELLNTIKKNNLMEGSPSRKQLGKLIEPLMGYTRTAFQITEKLENLRMSYLSCEKRGSTHAARRKCPHYYRLSDIYGDQSEIIHLGDVTEKLRECRAARHEIMLYIAEKFNVPTGPKLEKICYKLQGEISRSQLINGFDIFAKEEKNMLKDYIKSFAESKKCKSMDEIKVLKEFRKIVKLMDDYNAKQANCWMGRVTIYEPGEAREWGAREAANASKILIASIGQVQGNQPKSSNRYLQAKRAASNESNDNFKDVAEDNESSMEDEKKCGNKKSHSSDARTEHFRSRAWSNVETLLMLSLLQDLNLARRVAHRLSLEVVQVLVKPLRQRGYVRSPLQIQMKLRNLRTSYQKCLKAGRTKTAIAKCPYFHKLDEIYKKSHDETTPPGSQDVSELFSGHSVLEDSNTSSARLPGSSGVETICGGDSALDDTNGSSFETKLRIRNYDSTEETNGSNDVEDSHEESIYERVGQEMQKIPRRIEETEKRKTLSQKSSVRANSAKTRRLTRRKLRKNVANPYSSRTAKDSSTLRTMRIVMAQLLRHEKLLQRQHHSWMERQFEIQRKHDRDHRELLITELREFRESFNSAVPKLSPAGNQRVD